LILASALVGCDVSPLSEIYDSGLAPEDAGTDAGAPFPFDPSNFDPLEVPPAGELVIGGGACTFDTADLAFAGDGCRATPTALFGSQGTAVVAAADRMRVEADGELIVIGNRAAIFAVFDDASIEGRVFAGANGSTPGP